VTNLEYSQAVVLMLCDAGNIAQDVDDSEHAYLCAIAIDKFANINLAARERDEDRAAEYEQTMRHVRQTAGYLKYGAYGVFGGSK
jgi:hypothetical protein